MAGFNPAIQSRWRETPNEPPGMNGAT